MTIIASGTGLGQPILRDWDALAVRHVIYLLRHAKSSWDEPELLDHERPLAKRGRKAVALLREHFRDSGVAPDLVLCSSAGRAIQTLEGVRDGLPPGTRVETEAGLYAAGSASLLGRLRRLPEEIGSVMLVGHNPGIEDLATELAGDGDPDARATMEAKYPTGGFATLAFEGPWRELDQRGATLEAFAVPRRLG
jgi:phosphohistidine phosphatase